RVRMQHPTLFHGEQENEAVGQAHELLEIGFLGESTARQRRAQRLVVGMGKEALTEGGEGFFHTVPKLIAGSGAFLATGFAPCLEGARRDGLTGTAEASLVNQEPESSEVGV